MASETGASATSRSCNLEIEMLQELAAVQQSSESVRRRQPPQLRRREQGPPVRPQRHEPGQRGRKQQQCADRSQRIAVAFGAAAACSFATSRMPVEVMFLGLDPAHRQQRTIDLALTHASLDGVDRRLPPAGVREPDALVEHAEIAPQIGVQNVDVALLRRIVRGERPQAPEQARRA
jgi:hypothetical protein